MALGIKVSRKGNCDVWVLDGKEEYGSCVCSEMSDCEMDKCLYMASIDQVLQMYAGDGVLRTHNIYKYYCATPKPEGFMYHAVLSRGCTEHFDLYNHQHQPMNI